MRVLVTGGRNWLGDITCLSMIDITILIHGGASGADTRAAEFCMARGIHTCEVKALWNFYGRSAGHRRNEAMTILLPEYCVAFPGGRGTAGMVELMRKLNVPIWMPYP